MLQSIYVSGLKKWFFFRCTFVGSKGKTAYPILDAEKKGTYVAVSEEGPSSENYEWRFVDNETSCNMFRDMAYNEKTNTLFAVSETVINEIYQVVVFSSKDEGKTWKKRILPAMPTQKVVHPHKGMRWQNHCCEATIETRADGSIYVLCRTSYNHHYEYESFDDGETWIGPKKSPFHATLTMPLVKKLTTGEWICCWCNTQPIPEFNHEEQTPPLSVDEKRGRWEDYFTNRDANHIAISMDEGKTWQGFREMGLSAIRNESDYRSRGGTDAVLDKSVHQFELVELPYDKLLIGYGQSESSARLIILDKKWITETSRKEDFRFGLKNLTTHLFVKSNPGGFKGFSGHCSFNRTHGALLMPDPDMNFEETLFISMVNDSRLLSNRQGAVWNFPAGKSGRVCVRLRNDGDGVALTLTDRWFNAFDVEVLNDGQVVYKVNRENTPTGVWCDYELIWKNEEFEVYRDGALQSKGLFAHSAENGLSYLHILSLAEREDFEGTYIKYLEKGELKK